MRESKPELTEAMDQTLRLLTHTWGRIERTKTTRPYVSQDRGRAITKLPVTEEVFTALLAAKFIEESYSKRYFDKREIYVISQLGRNRAYGIRPFVLVKPEED